MTKRLVLLLSIFALAQAHAADQPQWGQGWGRNMVSAETGLPATFDPATGKNIKWSKKIGSNTHCPAVVASGRVLIGTNNERPHDPRHTGDRGVLLCLNEADGALLWQLVVPKLTDDKFKDWPRIGIVSPPTVEGDRVYVVTNRKEVVCLDLDGLADGNDGPFCDEGRFISPDDQPALDVGPLDADIIWTLDLVGEVGAYPHDSANTSIAIDGPLLYVNTSNGVDNTHVHIPAPEAPSLVALDKETGRVVAVDAELIGPRILHCSWASPSYGTVGGIKQLVFGGGDGVLYGFEPPRPSKEKGPVANLKKLWSFDVDPNAPKENVHEFRGNRQEGPSNITGMPVIYDGDVYLTCGGDVWQGKEECWLKRVSDGKEVWSYELGKHSCSTPSVVDGLVYTADCAGVIHCVDAETGKAVWTHDVGGIVWASTLVADGKVYIGTKKRGFVVLAAERNKRVLANVKLIRPMTATATAANGVLYVATDQTLYALKQGAKSARIPAAKATKGSRK